MPLRHPLLVRLLHLLFIVGACVQLFSSEFMKSPRPGRVLTSWQAGNFTLHDWSGTVMLGLALLYVAVRVLRGNARGPLHFFPWARAADRATLKRELGALLRREPESPRRLFVTARAIQGFGLLLVVFMGSSGVLLGQAIGTGVPLSTTMRAVKEVHEAGGSVLWAYLALHVAVIVPMLLARRFAVLDIFRVRPPTSAPPA